MSLKLTVTLSGRTLERYDFEDQDRIRMGRSEECEVTIDNLGVSRFHAEILKRDGFYVLRDLRSNNGTFVNGRRVDAHNLNNGDEISIGKFTIGFESELGGVPSQDLGPKGGDDFGGMTMQMDQAALAQLQREKSSRVRGYLEMEDKGEKKNVFLEKSVFLVGKGEDADIQTSGWFCPRKVAIIFRDESGFRLLDVTHKGGAVLVNGKPVDDVRLGDNDEIVIRGIRLKFMRGTPVA